VLEVADQAGAILFNPKSKTQNLKSVLDPRVAWLISDILSDNQARAPAFGENSVLRLPRPAAVKTGTTTDFRDNWTVGYTPQIVAGVWVGNADGAPMQRISGVSGAGPIWRDFMLAAHRSQPVRAFERPAGLVRREVCALSGLLPTPECTHTRAEWFLDGSQPARRDDWHRRVLADARTGAERVVLDLPAPLREWARRQGWPLFEARAVSADASAAAAAPGHIAIIQPDPGSVYRSARELPASVQRVPIEVRVDGRGIARVDVVLSTGEIVAQFAAAPYRAFWLLRPGEHTLVARAYFADGRVEDSPPVRVSVRR
jgi:membrane carboxypeptidase/penicillin-binding protein PbpC